MDTPYNGHFILQEQNLYNENRHKTPITLHIGNNPKINQTAMQRTWRT